MKPTPAPNKVVIEYAQAATDAGLRYVVAGDGWIRRVRAGKGVRYVNGAGRTVRDSETLTRIHSLVIPPAWTDVLICPQHNGHLQAVGRDARGRLQSRYHAHWRQVRDEHKYARLFDFGRSLGVIRRRVKQDLALPGLPREKVLATVVRLLEITMIRVGNEEYARTNATFGLTTFRNRHASIRGVKIHFEFRGKSGVHHSVDVEDRRLARIVRQCHDLPGQELFQYLDDNDERHSIDSADVNEYIRAISGKDFTAKDYRTWAGSLLAARELKSKIVDSAAEQKRAIVQAIDVVARQLGNTRAVCRKCYVHPAVIEAFIAGVLVGAVQATEVLTSGNKSTRTEERAFLQLLRKWPTK